MAGQTRIDGNLIDTGTDPNDIVSISTGDGRYPKLEGPNTLSGDLNVDSGTLFVDSTNGRVGVGTSSPSHELTLDKDQSNTVFTIRSANDGNSVVLLGNQDDPSRGSLTYENSNDALVFKVNNQQEAARVDSSGNVGIGTSSPSALLDVSGSAKSNGFNTQHSFIKTIRGSLSFAAGASTSIDFAQDSGTAFSIKIRCVAHLSGGAVTSREAVFTGFAGSSSIGSFNTSNIYEVNNGHSTFDISLSVVSAGNYRVTFTNNRGVTIFAPVFCAENIGKDTFA